jgi:hypothetical protein
MTDVARCTCEIKSWIAVAKQHSAIIKPFSLANWTLI